MPFFLTLFLYIAAAILSELLRPKPQVENARPKGLGDFDFPTATEGRVVPLMWGTVQITGPNVVWDGDLLQDPITVRQKTGLFSHQDVVTGYRYFIGIQFGLCRGTVDSLKHIWIGDDLVFSGVVTDGNVASIDKPDLFGGNTLGQGGVVGDLRFFAGTETQAISDYLSSRRVGTASITTGGSGYTANDILTVTGGSFTTATTITVLTVNGGGTILTAAVEDPGNYTVRPTNPVSVTGGTGSGATFNLSFDASLQNFPGGLPPAYRGTCYALWERGYIGNSTSIKPWKFELQRIVTGPATGSFVSVNGGADCNPVNVIYEVMTNTDWGLGIPAADIDSTAFSDAGVILHDEGNGFSMLLDQPMEASEFLNILQQQIDGVVFQNQFTGKWTLKLARGGYDINLVPVISPSTAHEIKSFSRGSWEETTNQVRTEFVDRGDSYKTTFALAQDMANIRIQNGTSVSVTNQYPGVKNRTLANAIAWRDLRTLSYPIAKGQVVMDRSFYATQPTDVLALTLPDLSISLLPVRVTRVDLGELTDNRVTIDFVEDVFTSRAGSYVDPPPSGWAPPADNLKAFRYQQVFEAPRGFSVRAFGSPTDRIWASGRRSVDGNEVGFLIMERHSAGTPSGAYTVAGEGFQFMLLGRLNAALAAGTAVPTPTIVIRSSPDLQADLLAALEAAVPANDLGTNLTNLLLIDDEFILVTTRQTSGGNVELDNVYRGALDTVQSAHANGSFVWLLSAGGALSDTIFTPTHNVDVALLPESALGQVDISDPTVIIASLTMANRIRRPYPPSSVDLNGSTFPVTTSLEGTGAGPETYGILAHMLRRDFRTVDEVAALQTDAGGIFADFPAANTTTHEVDVRKSDNTLLFTLTTATRDTTALRLLILRYLDGVLPSALRLRLRALHLVDTVSYSSRVDLIWDFAVTTALTGRFNFGARLANVPSNLYTATVAGTYNFTLSSAFTTGNVQYRLNGGAFTNLITAGNTTGNIAGVAISDTIEVRHTSPDVAALKQLDMDAPGAGTDAYFIPYT